MVLSISTKNKRRSVFWQIEKGRREGEVSYLFYIQIEGEEFINQFIYKIILKTHLIFTLMLHLTKLTLILNVTLIGAFVWWYLMALAKPKLYKEKKREVKNMEFSPNSKHIQIRGVTNIMAACV